MKCNINSNLQAHQTNRTTHANKSELSILVIGLNHQVGKRKPWITIIFVHNNRNRLKYLYMTNFRCIKSDFLVFLCVYKVNMLRAESDGACVMKFLHSHNEL
jgi:hypothetical protein